VKGKKFSVVCLVSIAVVLALAVACAAPTAPTAPEAKTIKVGIVTALSGPGSELEALALKSIPPIESWLNEQGGVTINGEKYLIDTIIEDGKGTAEGYVAAVTKLVNMDKVKFMIGGNRPDLIFALQSVTEPAKVLLSMGFGGGVPGLIGPDKPLSFRPSPAGAESIKNNYVYLAEAYPNVKTLALLGEQGPGGDFFGAVSKMEAEARGIKVVFNEMYPVGTKDFYPILTKAIAAKPDAMDIGVAFLEPLASMLKQGRELGYTGLMFTAGQPDMSLMLPIVGKEYADNYYSNCFDLASPGTPPMLKQIAQYYTDKGIDFKSDFLFQWDSAWCLAQAIQAAQSLDTTEIAATWENMTSIETGFGTGHMGGMKTYGAKHLVLRPMPITALIKGEAKTVKWIMPDIP